MDARSQFLLQDVVDQPVPLNSAQTAEGGTLDPDAIVTLAAPRSPGVARMQMRFILDFDACLAKLRPQRRQHAFRSGHPVVSSPISGRTDTLTDGSGCRNRAGSGAHRRGGAPLPESLSATMMRP